jgi:hypothetical protein
MRRPLMTALAVAMVAALPSGARAWVRPIAPLAPMGEPEPAPAPAEPGPSETTAPPETAAPPETPPPALPPSPPVETPPPAAAIPPLEPPVQPWVQPEGRVPILEAPAREPVSRPRLSAAVGMGLSYDSVGFSKGGTHAIPSFFTVLGIGDGVAGFDLGVFASSASREDRTQLPVDRLAVDGFGVFRPGTWVNPDDRSFEMRLLHALAAELGLGFERDGRSPISGTRFLVHLGARAEVPLSPAGEPTDLRLRLAVRRGVGLYTPKLSGKTMPDVLEVGDSAAEIYAALVAVF